MKGNLTTVVIALLGGGLLSACGEREQTLETGRKLDSMVWQTHSPPGFVADGWKPGDAGSWREQINVRAKDQNEYNRTSASR